MSQVPAPYAFFPGPGGDRAPGLLATGLAEVSHDPSALDRPGWWAVVGEFEGRWTCARFTEVRTAPLPDGEWTGPAADSWRSSLDQEEYQRGVESIRRHIATGAVYQVNLCRVLSAPLAGPGDGLGKDMAGVGGSAGQGGLSGLSGLRGGRPLSGTAGGSTNGPKPVLPGLPVPPRLPGMPKLSGPPRQSRQTTGEPNSPAGLARRLIRGNPAPYAGVIDLPGHGVRVVSASPELFLHRDGDLLASSPIKGTGRTEADLLPKDTAENVMIVDLVRNDLARVARTGSVEVTELCALEKHPGLVHLVSTVVARLRPGSGWPRLLGAAFPPGSVSGAPKISALRIIGELEPVPRGPYCGAFGWVDNGSGRPDRCRAQLAVGIRTFWIREEDADPAGPGRKQSREHGQSRNHGPGGGPQRYENSRTWLRFGTGAGITWGSDPLGEWRETELKAARLIALASRRPG
jgi:para-aminobenzoate synthetase component I